MIAAKDAGRDFEHIVFNSDTSTYPGWWVRRLRLNSRTPYTTEMSSNERDVKKFFGRAVFQWCTDRPGKKLTRAIAYRWGLTKAILFEDSATKEVEDDKNEMMEFGRIFYNPLHATKGLKLPSGLQYKNLHPRVLLRGRADVGQLVFDAVLHVPNSDPERS